MHKIKKKRIVWIFAALILFFLSSACTQNLPYRIEEVSVPAKIVEETEESIDNRLPASPSNIPQKKIYSEIGYTWEIDKTNPIIEAGRMELILQKAWVVDNIEDTQGTKESFYADAAFYTTDEDGTTTKVRCPDFIMENGSFIGGGQLVLLEIMVHNIDATSEIAKVDEYSSPYMFRADTLVKLEKNGYEIYPYFFERARKYQEHPMAFQVDPGGEETICIGFLISGNQDGSYSDLSSCKAKIYREDNNIVLVDLNLEQAKK